MTMGCLRGRACSGPCSFDGAVPYPALSPFLPRSRVPPSSPALPEFAPWLSSPTSLNCNGSWPPPVLAAAAFTASSAHAADESKGKKVLLLESFTAHPYVATTEKSFRERALSYGM